MNGSYYLAKELYRDYCSKRYGNREEIKKYDEECISRIARN